MGVITIRLEDDIKTRLDTVVSKLGLNQSRIVRDALVAKLEEMVILMERVRANRPKRPIDELWKELGWTIKYSEGGFTVSGSICTSSGMNAVILAKEVSPIEEILPISGNTALVPIAFCAKFSMKKL